MNFNDEMKKRVTEIRSIIEKYLPQEEGFQKTLLEAMNYSMLVGGKKLRPLLMQQTYVMFGGHKQGDRAVYGGDGDDPYPFADPR